MSKFEIDERLKLRAEFIEKARGWTEEQAVFCAKRDIALHKETIGMTNGLTYDMHAAEAFYQRCDMGRLMLGNFVYAEVVRADDPELFERISKECPVSRLHVRLDAANGTVGHYVVSHDGVGVVRSAMHWNADPEDAHTLKAVVIRYSEDFSSSSRYTLSGDAWRDMEDKDILNDETWHFLLTTDHLGACLDELVDRANAPSCRF